MFLFFILYDWGVSGQNLYDKFNLEDNLITWKKYNTEIWYSRFEKHIIDMYYFHDNLMKHIG